MTIKKLTLNDISLQLIIKELKKVLESSFEVNGRKFLGGEVKVHALINSKMYKDKPKPMILFSFNGSSGMFWCEGDVFEFLEDGTIKAISKNELFSSRKQKQGPVLRTFRRVKLTKREKYHAEMTVKHNKEYADDYWKSVVEEWEKEIERDFYDEDF